MNKFNLFIYFSAVVVIGTQANYIIHQKQEIANVRNLLDIEEKRGQINSDQLNELFLSQFRNTTDNDLVLAKNQGIFEGILKTLKPNKEQEFNDLWHDGYYHGMDQYKYLAANSYTEGYHLGIEHALQESGQNHPSYQYTSEKDSDKSFNSEEKADNKEDVSYFPNLENDEEVTKEFSNGLIKSNALVRSQSEPFKNKMKSFIEKQIKEKSEDKKD